MFSLLRGSRRGRRIEGSRERAYSRITDEPETVQDHVAGQRNDDDDNDDDQTSGGADEDEEPSRAYRPTSYFDQHHHDEDEDEEEGEEDEDAMGTPLLPIFSAAHLDRLPLYNITHATRLLIVQKCETTLSWDQLRSPQISQFLVKPVQSQIRTNHFNRATLCALVANCLQFQKEGQSTPGNIGVSQTRALISELLAMRLLKEFTTRELIDALSYDFDPLQGMMSTPTTGTAGQATPSQRDLQTRRTQARGARVSTIEIAIRAQAKRFLAHPLVVQHLEAIWAGTIVFHSEADSLHRQPYRPDEDRDHFVHTYGTVDEHPPSALPASAVLSRKNPDTGVNKKLNEKAGVRRSVTLYDPREASLFKLSRLRVPRYRQVFTTLSFAIMLALFITVLVDRSLTITPLEVVFWFWSIGYMLDEIVGFTEQGLGLYMLSFWNAFDLGILLLFVVYYCLRLYGIVLADQGKHKIAGMAYDVLASTAVLLFPRLFSVLDHYRYFSQLLIAFRMMAQDLIAILVLILISCSGFFVAFTLSFSDENTDGNAVAYALFQIVMGFTPAAWEKWSGYNILGKGIMTMFLVICHFLIVTILITVLTNSFMAIVRNANEEHQFLFAINTISMVKSDALFSYIAPANVIGWILSPLRYIVPFRQYVRINRTIIKVTHCPILFGIFAYERVILSSLAYDATDLVEKTTRNQARPLAFSISKAREAYSPGRRLGEPSVISFQKDRALDEVFRRPFRGSTLRTTTRGMNIERRNSTNVVDQWMQVADEEGGASPPLEQPRSVLEQLEQSRSRSRRRPRASYGMSRMKGREVSTTNRSIVSDPDIMPWTASKRPHQITEESEIMTKSTATLPQETDAEGDDENNNESDAATPVLGESAISVANKENIDRTPGEGSDEDDYFQTPTATRSPFMQFANAAKTRTQEALDLPPTSDTTQQPKGFGRAIPHSRKISSGTVLFAPQQTPGKSILHQASSSKPLSSKQTNSGGSSTPILANLLSGQKTPHLASGQRTPNIPGGIRTPNNKPVQQAKLRPILPPRQKTAPNATGIGLTFLDIAPGPRARRQPSFNARALDLASEIGDNKWGPSGVDVGGISGVPASFSEQLLREGEIRRIQREEQRRRSEDEEKGMVNRIMLTRMHTLEEGFREMLKEIKDLAASRAPSLRQDSDTDDGTGGFARAGDRPRTNTTASSLSGRGNVSLKVGATRGKKTSRKMVRRDTGKGKEVELVDSLPDNSTGSVEYEERTGEGSMETRRPTTAMRSSGTSENENEKR